MKLSQVNQLFAITTNLAGWFFVLTAGYLFKTFGFIVGGAFFMIFGMCLVIVSIIWLIIEQQKEVKKIC